jgi:hypothetical protein
VFAEPCHGSHLAAEALDLEFGELLGRRLKSGGQRL